MSEVISSIIATFVTIPLIGYIIVFVISKLITRQHRKSVKIAIDVTTLLLVIAVHYFILAIWDISLFWVILLFMIVVAIVFVFTHWKLKHEIHFAKVFKGVWRFHFLFFGLVYLLLLVYGLVIRISMAVSVM
ncbi:DUF3397 domain-containing protein [Niallia sp. Krafla_26]|uniref:DUF3397 domain-containing protein n=1 Tax=Niallia sp. Krafla_26 TaxID=3064703 RepID=UPI003D18179F